MTDEHPTFSATSTAPTAADLDLERVRAAPVTYVRFQSPTPGRRGVHTGVFGLTNLLGRAGALSRAEHVDWRAGNAWFEAAYPDPSTCDPSVYDEVANPLATAWFKSSATHLFARVDRYLEILTAHGVACVRVESRDPGRVIYEDDVQVVVVPHDVTAQTSFHPTSL